MKLNSINKVYIFILLLIVSATVYKIWNYKRWNRFYYSSSVCAPEYYPIHIRAISFQLPNDEFGAHFTSSKEEVNKFSTKWGQDFYSPKVYKPLFLPTSLHFSYFSYRDKLFYSDSIQLPQEKMLNVFKEAKKEGKTIPLYSYGSYKKGLTFLVGIANNGNLIIWLRGTNLEKEILRTQLKPQIPNTQNTYIKDSNSIDAYFEEKYSDLSDDIKEKIKNGYQKNANYIDSLEHKKRRN